MPSEPRTSSDFRHPRRHGHRWKPLAAAAASLLLILPALAPSATAKQAARPFAVVAGSMMPALLVGDWLMADMTAYDGRDPQRGDLVILTSPADGTTEYIKRIVGLPGDRVQMIGGVLNINGAPVATERLANYVGRDPWGEPLDAPRFRETLPNGAAYETLDTEAGFFLDDTDDHLVPAGHYFAMGDNRDNSADSRLAPGQGGLGDVPRDSIIGKVTVVTWSKDPARIGLKVK